MTNCYPICSKFISQLYFQAAAPTLSYKHPTCKLISCCKVHTSQQPLPKHCKWGFQQCLSQLSWQYLLTFKLSFTIFGKVGSVTLNKAKKRIWTNCVTKYTFKQNGLDDPRDPLQFYNSMIECWLVQRQCFLK